MILISVLSFEYPTPPLTTVMDEMVPLLNTGVRTAPKPSPEMSMSGGELYLLPAFRTITLSITPLLITASACAFSPERSLMFGFLSKLRISEDPYPTPLFER